MTKKEKCNCALSASLTINSFQDAFEAFDDIYSEPEEIIQRCEKADDVDACYPYFFQMSGNEISLINSVGILR